jgi:Acetyltransferase (GNAT) domain
VLRGRGELVGVTCVGDEARLLAPTAPEWAEALERASHDIYHVPEYVVLDARGSGGAPTAFWYAEGSRVLLLPLVLRAVPGTTLSDVVSPYGYSGPVSDAGPADTDFWHRACLAMVDTLSAHGVVTAFVRLNPLLPVPLDALGRVGLVKQHGETVSVDLSLSVEEMWRKTRRGHRKEINQARRAGVDVVVDEWDRLGEWAVTYYDNMRRVGAAEYYFFPVEHLVALHEALGDRMHLALTVASGEVIGGHVFFEYRGIVQSHLGSASRDGLECHSDKLLDDEMRRWTKRRGNSVYHLGGGLGGRDDALFWYKTGFSDRRHPFHTWRVVTDPAAYDAIVRQKGASLDSDLMSGYFPAYRICDCTDRRRKRE